MFNKRIFDRAKRALGRRAVRYLFRKSIPIDIGQPLVSFTFDDFPRSAINVAGRILEQSGFAGTYYASFGLMGTTIATGEMFQQGDLESLIANHHEIGCHTFDHSPAWETPSKSYVVSVERNIEALHQYIPGSRGFENHSFPISSPRVRTKRALCSRFRSCRAGGQTYNKQFADLAHLDSFFIERSVSDLDNIRMVIDRNARENGWLIFSTHDVCSEPSVFGCTPLLFSSILKWTKDSGARVLTVSEAINALKQVR